jgi:hypothetical protein
VRCIRSIPGNSGNACEAPEVTASEVKKHLKSSKPRKSADESGLVAELLREGSDSLVAAIASIFTAALQPNAVLPEHWKRMTIKVLYKKGHPKLPENYRPICIIPILYELFSKVLMGRVKPSRS